MPELAWHEKAALTVRDAAAVMSLGKDSIYKMIRAGEIHGIRLSGKTLVPVPEILRVLGIEKPPVPTAEDVAGALLTLFAERATLGRHSDAVSVPGGRPVASEGGLVARAG